MAAPIALIQGASRGLGLEFCKHILRSKSAAAVIATCRNPDGAAELRRLADQHPGRMTVLRLDVNRGGRRPRSCGSGEGQLWSAGSDGELLGDASPLRKGGN